MYVHHAFQVTEQYSRWMTYLYTYNFILKTLISFFNLKNAIFWSIDQRNLRSRSFSQLICLLNIHVHIYRHVQLLSAYLVQFSRRSFHLLFPLFIRYNTVRHFVPVTLLEWCQLHKDSCRAQKCRRGCWRGKSSILEGINREKERGALGERVKRTIHIRKRGTR